MDTKPRKIPNIPSELYEANLWKSMQFIGFASFLYFGFAAFSYLLVSSALPLYLVVPGVIICTIFSGQGLHLLGISGHEGFHFTLHKNKDVSASLGLFFSSAAIGHFDVGFSISHWNHHYYANTDKDPDAQLFVKFTNGFVRALVARPAAGLLYGLNTFKIAFNLPLGFKAPFPMSRKKLRLYAWANVLTVAAWLGIYAALFAFNPLYTVLLIGLGHFGAFSISGLRPYLEHAGMGREKLERTRSYVHPAWTAFFFYINYHTEHHLFPNVPFFNLPKVHALMKEHHLYEGLSYPVAETRFWEALRAAFWDSYPEAFVPESDTEAVGIVDPSIALERSA